MIGNRNDADQLRKLVQRVDALCRANKWPLSLMCGYKDGVEIGACASVHINPSDPDVQELITTKPKVGNPMVATLYTYQKG